MAHEMIYKHYLDNIQVNFITGKTSEYTPGQNPFEEQPTYNRFFYIVEGELKVDIGEHSFIANPGELVLFPKGTKQNCRVPCSGDRVLSHWIHFNATCNDIDLFELIKLPHKTYLGYNEAIMRLIIDIPLLSQQNDLVSMLKQKSALLQLITHYISTSASVIHYENYDERIENIIEYIQNNIDKDITVNDLATLSHLHPNYFIRFFKHQTGFAPMNFIADMRMSHAKDLLKNTDKSIGEIAVRVGINDYSYFSRQFKRNTSFSPSEYRQLMQNNEIENNAHITKERN